MNAKTKNPKEINNLGPSGMTIAETVRTHRRRLGLSHVALERRLTDIGHRISAHGLRRIEGRQRRVVSDDLTALAVALEVTPMNLLGMRNDSSPSDDGPHLTGLPNNISHQEARAWFRGDLHLTTVERRRFAQDEIQVLRLRLQQVNERIGTGANEDSQATSHCSNVGSRRRALRAGCGWRP